MPKHFRSTPILATLIVTVAFLPLAYAQATPPPPDSTAKPAQTTGDSVTPSDSAAHSTPVRRVGGSVLPPRLTYQVNPRYSEEARKAKFGGQVLVGAVIDEKGNPGNVHVIRGVGHGLDEKALEAVSQYRFKPATENGVPVKVALNIEINFQIYDGPPPNPPAQPPVNQP